MEHIESLQNIHLNNSWLTIGTFDGVHLGHQEILNNLLAGAHAANAPAVVLTFYPHPPVFFGKRSPSTSLTTPIEMASIMDEMGIEYLVTQPFTIQTANTSALDFIRLLKSRLGFTWLGVGYDFALGKDRQGDVKFLASLADEYAFTLRVFSPVEQEGFAISSSRIRSFLLEGDVQSASKALGHTYSLSGVVVVGDGRGRTIGIPTANLRLDERKLVPGSGVYACRASLGGVHYPAAVNIGNRPTFDGDQAKSWVEAHILDFSADIYSQTITLEFISRLRGEMRFPGIDELLFQIHLDIEKTRELVSIA